MCGRSSGSRRRSAGGVTSAFTVVPLSGQRMADHALPSLERCFTVRAETNSNDFGGFWISRFEFDFVAAEIKGMNRAQRCDGHKRHQSVGGLGCIIMRTTCGHFGTSVCRTKTRPSLPCFRSDAGGSRLVLSGPQARYAGGPASLHYRAVTEPH